MNYKFAVALLTGLLACGGKKDDKPKTKEDAAAGPTVAPIATPAIGIDSIRRMHFSYGGGDKEYEKAVAQAKAKNWPSVKSHCEAAIGKDQFHLDARWLCAAALAQVGEHAAAVDHIVAALAGDYFAYAPNLKTEDLKPLFSTPHGTAVNELAEKLRSEYVKRIANGVLVIGRRSKFKYDKEGVQWVSPRGELYAFDRETKRFLRLTHTKHEVAGFVRAPSGDEIAVFGFDQVDRPKGDDATPLLVRSWIQVLDTKDWKVLVDLQLGGAREVHVGYGAGDRLLVATAPANGRWGLGDFTISNVDKTGKGKLTKVKADLPVPRIAFSLDEGRVIRATDGIKATWSGDPPTTPTIAIEGGATITVPESGAASQGSVALSPDKARVAFATAVDPCAKDASPSIYVGDAKGTFKHLITSKSRFVTRWIDPTTLAYEDGEGAIRLWDATTGREAMKIENKAGIALEVLSLAPAPLCKGAPPLADVGAGSGDEPPLPPEEGSADGPVTKPN